MVPLSTNGLDLREGQSIAELAAQQSGDDVDNDEDGANGGTDDATAQSAADAPGLNSDPDSSNQDVDTLPDDAASNGVETSTDSAEDAANPVAEADKDSRSRLLELDLADLGQRTAAAASAPSASDTAEVLTAAAEPTSSTPASVETGDSPSERAASARAAVAGLSLALGIDTPQDGASAEETEGIDADSDDHLAPRTLAELEAILPDRS